MEKVEALKSVCVDTDVIIDYLRGKSPGSQLSKTGGRKSRSV